MANGQTAGAAAKTPIRQQSTGCSQVLGLDVGSRVEHLLHARPALGSLVADHHHIAFLYPISQDALAGCLLGLEDPCRALENPYRFIHSCGFYNAAFLGDIAVEHGQPAISGIGAFQRAHTALLGIQIGFFVIFILRESLGRAHIARCRHAALAGQLGQLLQIAADEVLGDHLAQSISAHRARFRVDLTGLQQLGQDSRYAAGPRHVLDVEFLRGWRDFADTGYLAR